MSYLSDASLVMIPSGVEAGTVFTSKPAGGSADLTFTRSNDTATRVGPNGYIEKVRTNLLTYSQDFSAAAGWGGSGITATANYGTAPDGTNTSTQIVFTSGSQIWRKDAGVNGLYGNFSLWIKGTAGETITLTFGNNSDKVVTLGSGWNRFSTDGNLATNPELFINTFVGATARTIEVWGGQAEVGDIATDYIETTTAAVSVGPLANVPRINFDPVLPRTGSLLLEPQRTNLITFSEQLNNAAWTIGSATISANATTSPSGYQDADIISTTAANSFAGPVGATIAADSTTYTQSVFVKYISGYENFKFRTALTGGSSVAVASVFNANTGTLVSTDSTAQIVDYGNGWYRVSHQITNNGTNTNFIFQLYPSGDAVNTNSMAFWGAQAEAGSYVTSYIPTYGAAATRANDIAIKSSVSDVIGQTEGTLYWEGSMIEQINNDVFYIGGSTDGIAITKIFTTSDRFRFYIRQNGAQTLLTSGAISNVGQKVKVAIAYKSGDIVAYVNGTQQASSSISLSFSATISSVLLANSAFWLNYATKNCDQALLFKTRLTNDQLSQITTL